MIRRCWLMALAVLLSGPAFAAAAPARAVDKPVQLSATEYRVAVGTTVTLTAKISGISSTAVDFVATSPTSEKLGSANIMGDSATLDYRSSKPISLTIVARANYDLRLRDVTDHESAPITVVWAAPDPVPELSLSPNGVRTAVGSTFTAKAVLTVDGKQVDGVIIHFRVTGPGQTSKLTGVATSAGRATFSFDCVEAGTNRVTASVRSPYITREITHECVAPVAKPPTTTTTPPTPPPTTTTTTPPPPTTTTTTVPPPPTTTLPPLVVPLIVAAPEGTSGLVGSRFSATATVTKGGQPVVGRRVTFRAIMSGQPELTGTATTDAAGIARWLDLTRPVAGTDVIWAEVAVDGISSADRIDRRWTMTSTQALKPSLGTITPGKKLPTPACPPGSPVVVSAGGAKLAAAQTGPDGELALRSALQNLPVGRHAVQFGCGRRVVERTVDVVAVSATTGTAAASVVTSGGVLLFFLLLGIALGPGRTRLTG